MMDPDEKVRIASVKVVGRFNLLCAQHVSKPLLTAVGDRCRDKKVLADLFVFFIWTIFLASRQGGGYSGLG